jgi:monomeric isocitrate dehydrogenase
MKLVKLLYNEYGEETDRKVYDIKVLYDNQVYDIEKSDTSKVKPDRTYSIIYKALINPNELTRLKISVDSSDRVLLGNREYGVLVNKLIEYNGKQFLYVIEYGL